VAVLKLYELHASEVETGYYDPNTDKINQRIPTDTRKPVLTLRHLNRLKKMRALKRLENLKRQDLLTVMYAGDEDGGGMGGPPGF
jgi:23S rRNA G2069 N7-methylase RlmK/C1962 C5-methylase RlmI